MRDLATTTGAVAAVVGPVDDTIRQCLFGQHGVTIVQLAGMIDGCMMAYMPRSHSYRPGTGWGSRWTLDRCPPHHVRGLLQRTAPAFPC